MDYRRAAKLLFSFTILGLLFWFSDVEAIASNISKADPGLYLAAVALFLTTYAAASLRWRNLSRSIGYDLGLTESFRLIAVSYSFNKLFPGNAGDAVRSKIFERYEDVDSHGKILGIVALERYLGVLSLLTIIFVSLALADIQIFEKIRWVLAIFGFVSVGFGLALLVDRDIMKLVLGFLPGKAEGFLLEVMEGYQSSSRADLVKNLFLSLYIRSVEAVMFFLILGALSADIGLWEGALVMSTLSLVSAIPVSPGGLGTVDATGAALLTFLGTSYSLALSVMILQRSIGLFLMGLVGATVYTVETYYPVFSEIIR
ncbi:MAG: lysylphosphatidylglycerol synthase transmembrane domain-containing protein [Candidatus Nanohaloarchaea archaeon]